MIERDMAGQVPTEFRLVDEPAAALIAPMSWEPDEFAALVVLAPDIESTASPNATATWRAGSPRSPRSPSGSARHVSELERFHELAETLDAIFWEADAADARLHVPVDGGRPLVLGPGDGDVGGAAAGDGATTSSPEDRAPMTSTLRAGRRDPRR